LRTVADIDTEIADLRRQLAETRGTETEIYTRIVGYYRSLTNWNKGKRDEYNLRRPFDAQNVRAHESDNGAHDKPERRRSFIPEQAGAHQAIAGFQMLALFCDRPSA